MPNIVYILADDMGYGDVRCLNENGKIPTPHMDRLAAEGMTFTDAHSGSAVCTPTRYGFLTGRYAWRTRLARGVLMGYSAPLIAPGRMTVASFLKSHGYATAGFGKWHLGLGLPTTDGKPAEGDGSNVDFAKPIANGPTSLGFDTYYGISASLDMPPYVYIDNDKFAGVPTTTRKYIREGLATEDFEAVDVLPKITAKAVEYIEARAKAGAAGAKPTPFFLYLPLNAPHTPIAPTKEFQGKSGLNDYGDFVMQVDDTVGQVLGALDRAGLADDTLVIVTSDNGCSPQADFELLASKGHDPSLSRHEGGYLRGRTPHPLHRPLAGTRQGGQHQRPGHLPDRPAGHLRRHPGPEAARRRRRGLGQHPARPGGPDPDAPRRRSGQAPSRGHRASLGQRLVLDPPRQMEARALPRIGRLEPAQTQKRRRPEAAARPALRPVGRHRRAKQPPG